MTHNHGTEATGTHTLLLFLPVITKELTFHMKANPALSTNLILLPIQGHGPSNFLASFQHDFYSLLGIFHSLHIHCNFFHHAKKITPILTSFHPPSNNIFSITSKLSESLTSSLFQCLFIDYLLIPSNQFVVNSSLQVLLSKQPMTFIF